MERVEWRVDYKRSQGQSSLEVTFLVKLFCSSLCKLYRNDSTASFVYLWEISDGALLARVIGFES